MDGSFDVTTLILLAVAVVIFLKLRGVLGRKTGNERPPFESPRRSDTAATQGREKVIAMPRRSDGAVPAPARQVASAEALVDEYVADGSPIKAGLLDIARADASFNPTTFLTGARAAYEMIVVAFANGDRKALRPLLARDVFDGFVGAIGEREQRGETVETKFVGINQADIVEAECRSKTAQVTVKFVSQLITAIRDRAGNVIEGDPRKVSELTDIWTFARDTSSRDPNWKLVATQAAI